MEKYKPSEEEINKAEEMMTDEQRKMSMEREASPGIEDTKKQAASLEQNPEKESHELATVPIFRNNDLYQAVFPEIKPLFEKGEELDEKTSVKKIMDRIVENKDKAIILDGTCLLALEHAKKPEDFPAEFGLKEVPTVEVAFGRRIIKKLDLEAMKILLKTHFNIDFSEKEEDSIDNKIGEQLSADFSPETVKNLLEIAEIKNPNIKRVYILTNSLVDHFNVKKLLQEPGEYSDSAKEFETTMPLIEASWNYSGWSPEKLKEAEQYLDPEERTTLEAKRNRVAIVLAVFKKAIQEKFGVEPVIEPTIKAADVLEGDLVIIDRHNINNSDNVDKKIPRQVSLLPLESELRNNEERLGKEFANPNLIKSMRAKFEKKK